jgi:L-methionine (R)-S-oxide reductase
LRSTKADAALRHHLRVIETPFDHEDGMSDIHLTPGATYDDVAAQARALAEGPNTRLSLLANIASLLYWSVPDVNWVGFYLLDGDTLWLGPFHGRPACVSIPLGRGVCGTAARERRTLVVDDVHAFDGHIACDAASRSEIVVPLIYDGCLSGVLDVDSPHPARFTETERILFEQVAGIAAAGGVPGFAT